MPLTAERLLERVRGTIHREGLLAGDERIIVALSGGADSVGLLHLLRRLADEGSGRRWELLAVHVHHGVRGEAADEDAYFAQEAAEAAGVAFSQRSFVPGWFPSEDRLRRKRYHLLASEALGFGAGAIALGHNADDQAETVLHRLARGTGPRGLAGMPYARELEASGEATLVRPLLDCARAEILEFLEEEGIPWREDASNLDPRYTRNRIRHEVLPLIEEALNPRAREALCRVATFSREMLPLLDGAATALLETARAAAGGTGALDVDGWREAPAVVIGEALRRAYVETGGREKQFSREMVDGLVEAIRSGAESYHATWPGRMQVRLRENHLRIGIGDESGEREAFGLTIPGRVVCPWAGVEIRASLRSREEMMREGGPRADDGIRVWADAVAIRGAVEVRPWGPGERMRPYGGPSEKDVREVLADGKVPAADRPDVPVVADREGVLWLVGVRRGGGAAVTGDTQSALLLEALPLDEGLG